MIMCGAYKYYFISWIKVVNLTLWRMRHMSQKNRLKSWHARKTLHPIHFTASLLPSQWCKVLALHHSQRRATRWVLQCCLAKSHSINANDNKNAGWPFTFTTKAYSLHIFQPWTPSNKVWIHRISLSFTPCSWSRSCPWLFPSKRPIRTSVFAGITNMNLGGEKKSSPWKWLEGSGTIENVRWLCVQKLVHKCA